LINIHQGVEFNSLMNVDQDQMNLGGWYQAISTFFRYATVSLIDALISVVFFIFTSLVWSSEGKRWSDTAVDIQFLSCVGCV
jgi:hypothetical protein